MIFLSQNKMKYLILHLQNWHWLESSEILCDVTELTPGDSNTSVLNGAWSLACDVTLKRAKQMLWQLMRESQMDQMTVTK